MLRTEFLFLDRRQPPSEEEQLEVYRTISRALDGLPLVIRLLDAGGDKPLPYLRTEPESNPFLGVRGIRLLLARPGLLRTQLRAVLSAASESRVRLLIPMVTSVTEVRTVKEMLSAEVRRLRAEGVQCAERLEVGAMVEVPAAAVRAGRLAAEADFLSIGTNDLAQYVTAAERGGGRLSDLCDGMNPAVLRLIRETATAGAQVGVPVAVCGEIAGEPAAVPVLVGLGVRELSMNPSSIPEVKRTLSLVSVRDSERLAEAALDLDTATQVRNAAVGLLRKVRD